MKKRLLNILIQKLYSFVLNSYGLLAKYLSFVIQLPPILLRIRITNKCNLHCNFCYLNGYLNTGESNHLSLLEWQKCLSTLPKYSVVDITGAEPLLANNFKEILSLILQRGHKVSITTNGLLSDDTIIELMVKEKLNFLMISLDGLSQYHNKVRGHQKSFEKAEAFINKVNTLKNKYNSIYPLICIKTTVLEDNIDQLSPLSDYIFEKMNIDQHTFNLLFDNKARGGAEVFTNLSEEKYLKGNTQTYAKDTHEKIIETLDDLLKKSKKLSRQVNIKPTFKNEDWKSYIRSPSMFGNNDCKRYSSVLSMYYDGTLTPCDINFPIANIKEIDYNFSKLWVQNNFQIFKSHIEKFSGYYPACEGCCLANQSLKK